MRITYSLPTEPIRLAICLLAVSSFAAAETVSLKGASESIRNAKACRDIVGIELSYSFPLPALTSKGLRYRQMFYREYSAKWENDPDAQVMPPRIFAQYDLDGTDMTCELEIEMPYSEFGKPIGALHTPATRKMKHAEWQALSNRLLSATETLGNAYAAGRTDDRTLATTKEFQSLFDQLGEPELKAHYRALSPRFWRWLKEIESKHHLKLTHEHIHSAGECRHVMGVPISFSLPVPVRGPKGVRYRQMFYRTYSPQGPADPDRQAMPPGIFAEYDVDGSNLNCELEVQMPQVEFGKPAGPALSAAVKKMSSKEWDDQIAIMLSKLEALAPAFAAKRNDNETRKMAGEFRSLFDLLSEPGLREHYRMLSPDFWRWLRDIETKRRPLRSGAVK